VNLSGQSRDSARRRCDQEVLALYTNEVMTENLSIYEHLGFSEIARRTEDGYRRIYMEKMLPDFG